MYEQITANKRKSFALFAGFLLLYGLIAYALYLYVGPIGGAITMGIAVVMSLTALFGGDDLAVRVAGGQRVERKEDAPELWRMVENLAITAGLPMPRLYISPDPSANAFAAGRTPEQAIVCVNQGLLNVLDDAELEGVIAHELTHVRNYDVRLMTYATVLAGSIALIAQLLSHALWFSGGRRSRDSGPGGIIGLVAVVLVIVLAPIAATIIQLAISRKREYVADAGAVDLTRYPQGLASALMTISGDQTPPQRDERTIAHMMIAPQLTPGGRSSALFSTHPPTEDRIAKLMEMAGGVPHQKRTPVAQQFIEGQAGGQRGELDRAQSSPEQVPAPAGWPTGLGAPADAPRHLGSPSQRAGGSVPPPGEH
ncbi:MAG: M48 family metallopeptidase [Patulibacter minatonensis]